MEGRLAKRSKVPTPKSISPYTEALVVYEYEVVRVLRGLYLPKHIRVAHWAVLGGESLASGQLAEGDTVSLEVCDFNADPKLETVHLSDTLDFDFDLPLYFDLSAPLLGKEDGK